MTRDRFSSTRGSTPWGSPSPSGPGPSGADHPPGNHGGGHHPGAWPSRGQPAELRMVDLTHMDSDHTGGLAGLRDCPIVVQWAEHRFAFAPDGFVAGQYMRNHIDVPVAWEPIEGDRILVPGVSVIRTTGHSPGHQSVLVRLDSGGWYLITGDAVPTLENVQL